MPGPGLGMKVSRTPTNLHGPRASQGRSSSGSSTTGLGHSEDYELGRRVSKTVRMNEGYVQFRIFCGYRYLLTSKWTSMYQLPPIGCCVSFVRLVARKCNQPLNMQVGNILILFPCYPCPPNAETNSHNPLVRFPDR